MAVKFAIRNYSRSGNNVTFTVIALNADGSVDTAYTGNANFVGSNMTAPANYTFVAGDQGQRVFSATITNAAQLAAVVATLPGSGVGTNLTISAPGGSAYSVGNVGDHLHVGGPGNDSPQGSSGNELFLLQSGGDDIPLGREGDDGFYFGPAYTSADRVDGGEGNDQIGLQGNYNPSGIGAVTLGSLLNTELVVLLPGNDARFGDTANNSYDYSVIANGSTIVSNNRLTIQANMLREGEDFSFNGAASGINFLLYGGMGTDTLTGGSGNDGFFFGQGRFGSNDMIDGGGGGTGDQLALQGNFSVTFGASQLSNLEFIVLLSAADTRFGGGGAEFDYSLTMNDGNVAAGQTMTISANRLGAEESLAFNGSAETNGRFEMFGGAGNDVLIGGAGKDLIYGGGRGDTLTGGAGRDIFLYTNVTDSNSTERDGIQDFNAGDRIDVSPIDANTNVAGNQDFTFVGTSAFSGAAGELRFENISLGGPIWIVQADVNGDRVSDLEIVLVISPADPITVDDFIGVNAPAAAAASEFASHDVPVIAIASPSGQDHAQLGLRDAMRIDHLDLAIVPTHDLLI